MQNYECNTIVTLTIAGFKTGSTLYLPDACCCSIFNIKLYYKIHAILIAFSSQAITTEETKEYAMKSSAAINFMSGWFQFEVVNDYSVIRSPEILPPCTRARSAEPGFYAS